MPKVVVAAVGVVKLHVAWKTRVVEAANEPDDPARLGLVDNSRQHVLRVLQDRGRPLQSIRTKGAFDVILTKARAAEAACADGGRRASPTTGTSSRMGGKR